MVHISINDFLMLQQSDIDPTTKVQSIRRIYRGVNSVIHITQIYLFVLPLLIVFNNGRCLLKGYIESTLPFFIDKCR